MPSYIQTIACKDQPNLINTISGIISDYQGNIIEIEQHVAENTFFLRIVWDSDLLLSNQTITDIYQQKLQDKIFYIACKIKDHKTKVAILVSKLDHCLFEILMRYRNNEWHADIPLIISNHSDLSDLCHKFSIPFHYLPITDKATQEQKILELLAKEQIELVVLARYMQILSGNFVQHYPNAIINIHHSFLPAFVGAKPYHQAHAKGVKMVGATSHYVTEDLDQGPIICQQTTEIDHTNTVDDLVHMGKDIEKKVLTAAISAHITQKIIVIDNKTIVFR